MRKILICLFSTVILTECSDKKNDEVINEVEQNINMKLPANTDIVYHKAEGTSGDYTSHTSLQVADQKALNELVTNILHSNNFIGKDKISAHTHNSYWTRDEKSYIFRNNRENGSNVSFDLDTVERKIDFLLKEVNHQNK